MYDDSEEISRKRRRLYIIIGIVVFLIVLIILFLLIRMGNKGSSGKSNDLSCKIAVINDSKPDENGIYRDVLEVGFTEINYNKKKSSLIKQTVGTADSPRNTETFKIITSGKYKMHGYLQDSDGNEAVCDLELVVELNYPTCELEVTEGVAGGNGWYKSDVVVSFKDRNTNNPNTTIAKYFIEKTSTAIDINAHGNSDKFIVSDNKETSLTGYIVDSEGTQGSCSIVIKKDNTIPSCSLKITEGTTDANGQYIDNPKIGFEDAVDEISGIVEKGIGTSKNYTNDSFTVTTEGTTTINGYVKDKAGNEGTCSISITKAGQPTPTPPTPTPPTPTPPTPTGTLSCRLSTPNDAYKINSNTILLPSNSKIVFTLYVENATAYGIGETETYNGQREFVIDKEGTYRFRGYAMNSAGQKCVTNPEAYFVVKSGEWLFNKVKKGDYVEYEAGKNTKWIVYGVNGRNVILLSAVSPETVTHKTDAAATINAINSKANKHFNKTYADSARALTCSDLASCAYKLLPNNPLLVQTDNYFAASKADSNKVYMIQSNGEPAAVTNVTAGIKIMVTLNEKVVTTGGNGTSGNPYKITRY